MDRTSRIRKRRTKRPRAPAPPPKLKKSSSLIKKLTDPEYDVISGPKLVEKTLQEFSSKPELKLLDILFCDGGCINGAGVITKDSLDRRRQKIIGYWKGR